MTDETTKQSQISYEDEMKQIKEEKGKSFEEVFPPSWKIPKGTTIGKFLSDERKSVVIDNNVKKILTVEVGGQTYSWWINHKNPVYGQIIKEGTRRGTLVGVRFSITRVGEMKDTRYEINWL